jgi:hypothetical protein
MWCMLKSNGKTRTARFPEFNRESQMNSLITFADFLNFSYTDNKGEFRINK